MKEKHTRNKPSGLTGPVKVEIVPSGANLEFQKFQFPQRKEEIEELIAKGFIGTICQIGDLVVTNIRQNQLDDLDFTLDTPGAQKFLELMEIAPLENLAGSYDKAPSSYKGYDFAEYILAKAIKKSNRYSGINDKGIILLVYVTDWHFILSETVVALLQYWMLKTAHNFERVYYYKPVNEQGIVSRIFPTPKEFWRNFNPDLYRDNITYNFNPATHICKL